jgi:hypothetical protein
MRKGSPTRVVLLILTIAISLLYIQLPKGGQEDTIAIQPTYAQFGVSSDTMVLNETNITTQTAPIISENKTATPAPEVNDTLIGRSTPTTSNNMQTDKTNNTIGEAEPLGGIK